MDVKTISMEKIKPSSPTPDHLKTYKFSLIDQLIPAPYVPLALFYPNNVNIDISRVLKKSLSEVLTRFYPLAGKIKDEDSIDCDDEGVKFVEARVGCDLKDFLRKPDMALVHHLLPCDLDPTKSSDEGRVVNVQLNVFECGGIALGFCISHKALDGSGQCAFLKAWAEATRITNAPSRNQTPTVVLPGASLFPPRGSWLRDEMMAIGMSLVKLGTQATKRFVFNASAIANLRAQAASSSVQHPSRVEAVTACLWKSIVKASTQRHGSERPSLVIHAVNLRRRASPPLPENAFGNLFWSVAAKHHKASDLGMKGMVRELREALSGVDAEFVRRMGSDEWRSEMEGHRKEIVEFGSDDGPADRILFSSWCKFGFYDGLDFGWGRPLWASTCVASMGPAVMNVVMMMDTRSGDGVEALVNLDEKDMAIVEKDPELLSLASVDPSPLHY